MGGVKNGTRALQCAYTHIDRVLACTRGHWPLASGLRGAAITVGEDQVDRHSFCALRAGDARRGGVSQGLQGWRRVMDLQRIIGSAVVMTLACNGVGYAQEGRAKGQNKAREKKEGAVPQ